MRPSRLLPILFLLLSQRVIAAEPEETTQLLREKVLKASTSSEKAKAYKQFFLKGGRAGLSGLTKDEDTGIALQAAWEVHKKAVKRPMPINGHTEDSYDSTELKKFTTFLNDRTKATAPPWWNKAIVDTDVHPWRHHAFVDFNLNQRGPKLQVSKAGYTVPEGAQLEKVEDRLRYTAGGRSNSFKARFKTTL